MRRQERELVEVVLDGLDLAVVANLVPEPEERVLDRATDLRDRVQMADGQLLARQRDVDHLLAQAAVELLVRERPLAFADGALEPLADPVQEHAAVAIADPPQRLGELALAAEVADARIIELGGGRGGRDRFLGLALVCDPIHGGDCNFVFGQKSSSFAVAGRACPGTEREVRRRAPGSRFRTGAR